MGALAGRLVNALVLVLLFVPGTYARCGEPAELQITLPPPSGSIARAYDSVREDVLLSTHLDSRMIPELEASGRKDDDSYFGFPPEEKGLFWTSGAREYALEAIDARIAQLSDQAVQR